MINQETNQPVKNEPRFFYGYIVVAVALCIIATMFGTRSVFGVFFKPMISEFGWTRAMTSGAFSLSMIMQGLSGIAMGDLNDRLGPRVVMTLCGFLLGLGYLLTSQASTLWQLYLFYGVLIGIGMGGVFVPLMSTIARWFVKRRGMMTSIALAGIGAGTFIMPLVVNWLISIYGWRNSYIIMGAFVLVIVILASQFLRRDPTKMGQVPYGENKDGAGGLKLKSDSFSFGEAVYTRQFWFVSAIVFCVGFCLMTIPIHIVPHAIDLKISATSSANILATIGAASIVSNLVMGSASDRIGGKRAYIISFILTSVALLWLIPFTELWQLYLFAIVFGFGSGSATPLQSPLIARLFGLRSHGMIFGSTNFGFTLGGAIGPILTGYIFDVTGSYQMAFQLCVAVGIVGIIMSIVLKPTKRLGGRI